MADEFDDRRMGCPLVQLKKSCREMRATLDCPKWRRFLVRNTKTGADDMIDACADWWQPLLLRDLVAATVRTEKAVEVRGDRQADGTNQVAKLLLAIGAGRAVDLTAELQQIHDRQLLIAAPPSPAAPAGTPANGNGAAG